MDVYHPRTVYSSIDNMGRYAYGNQPRIAQWNLARLAETLLPLLAEDKDAAVKEAHEAIDAFATGFETAYAAGQPKLGLFQPRPDDLSLAQDLLERMARNGADFTLIFRRLCDAAASPDGDAGVRSLFTDPSSFDDWAARGATGLQTKVERRTSAGRRCVRLILLSSRATIWWRRRSLRP